ncbi:TPA: hypothetical protein N0F65_008040, partial [Lagenidium giganteum]
FVYLCIQGALVIAISQAQSLGSCIALYILIAVAAQGAGGSSFGIVPYVNEQYTGSVTGLVGAGGNIGGVVFGLIFKAVSTRQEGLLVMGIVILVGSLTTWAIRFDPAIADTDADADEEADAMSVATTAVMDAPESDSHVTSPALGLMASAARVAPLPVTLPLTEQFQAGKVLGNALNELQTAQHEEEVAYIPVALAKAHLEKVVQDMHDMKREQQEKVRQIVDKFKLIEESTKVHYETYIKDVKQRAKDRIQAEEFRYKTLEDVQRLEQEQARLRLDSERARCDAIQRAHQDERRAWQEESERCLLQHEEALTRLQQRCQQDIDRLMRQCDQNVQKVHASMSAQLQMSWEDLQATSSALRSNIARVQADAKATFQMYEAKLRSAEMDAIIERESLRCLNKVVNRVVDAEHQKTLRKKTNELKRELDRLETERQEAMQREQSLTLALRDACKRYDDLEAAAVMETMEFLVCAVERTPLFQSVGTDALACVSTSQVSTQSQTVEVLRRDQEQQCEIVAVESDVGVRPLDQANFELEIERLRARDLEVLHSKHELKEVKSQLADLLEKKNATKAKIKSWLAEFNAQHGRDPTIEEKALVKDMYMVFKDSEEAYLALKERVASMKEQHHEKALQNDALNHWHAVVNTSGVITQVPNGSKSMDSHYDSHENDEQVIGRLPQQIVERVQERASLTSILPSVDISQSKETSGMRIGELEREVSRLRSELEIARERSATIPNAMAPQAVVSIVSSKHTPANAVSSAASVPSVLKPQVLSPDADHEMGISTASVVKTEVSPAPNGHDAGKEQEREKFEAEQRRLQEEIQSLSIEIAERRDEKALLERQIEQLRLHVELMAESPLHSEAKGPGRFVSEDSDHETENEQQELPFEEDKGDDIAEDEHAESELEAVAEAKIDEEAEDVDDEPADEVADVESTGRIVSLLKEAIDAGKTHWNRGDKVKCFQTYAKTTERCIDQLKQVKASRRPSAEQNALAMKKALAEASKLPPARGSVVLRKRLDALLEESELAIRERETRRASRTQERAEQKAQRSPERSVERPMTGAASPAKKAHVKASKDDADGSESVSTPTAASNKVLEEYKQKLKALESRAKADRVKITQLEAALAKAETQAAMVGSGGGGGNGGGGGGNNAAMERRMADMEKKHKNALEDAEKSARKEINVLTQQLQVAQTKSAGLQEQVDKMTKELATLAGKATQLTKIEEEVVVLRQKAADAVAVANELAETKALYSKLEVNYKEEQSLRKKYYNQIEDMKGKIRVYARCRPMSSSELERGCTACVRYVDEYSLELDTARGPKPFAYDQVFTPASTQEEVFEDTKNLLQSAMDGYNVCIFAYGQTGSGKTFTMTGTESMPGLSPRAIHHIFALAEQAKDNHVISFQVVMLELYNDTLIDLLALVDGAPAGSHDKLEIKKNEKGMVFVANSTTKTCTTPQQTLRLFEAANKKRQVGATKMNAESSRSHSVFSILIENYNKTTKTTSTGKLSLVDLAGSERAAKTGATAERMKEAQAINKSLSALGDVIAALSNGEKFIPYRNNKLTQLMQDSLGGNAKTLMFVNISPADYNQEETQTSLTYASRVKLITNNANKNAESELVSKLKGIIKALRAGKQDVDLDGLVD